MRIQDTLSTAYRGVTSNVMRALLTMLGIIIGVGSVVLMTAIGSSMEGVILGQISSLGARSMVVFPGRQEGGPNAVSTGFDSLTFDDVAAVERLATVETPAPVIFLTGQVTYAAQEASPQVLGVVQHFFVNQNIDIASGRLIDKVDVDTAASVAVVGPETAIKLFGNAQPLGKRIKIGANAYTVIGVTKALGSQFFQNVDDRIYVPFSMARQVTGQKYINYMTMRSVVTTALARSDVTLLLRQRHKIDNPDDDPEKDDFVVRSADQANDILGTVSIGLTAFITTIAAISLVVGGIGIMNIMIVAVTERTREIGLRKAVGARGRDILLQFLLEAVMLTIIGAGIGAVLGVFLAFLASLVVRIFLESYHFALSPVAIIVAIIVAGLTGIAFGIAPARKAANLHPIEALRYE